MERCLWYSNANGRMFKYKLLKDITVLRGDLVKRDSLLSIVERGLAYDHSNYYDVYDAKQGVCYESDLPKCSVEKLEGADDCRCIRYAGGDSIRSFTCRKYLVGDKVEVKLSDSLVNYTEYTRLVSDVAWMRLISIIGTVLGTKSVVSLTSSDVGSKELIFNMSELPRGLSEECFKVLYLLLSEAIFSKEKVVILVSELSLEDKDVLERLLSALASISNVVLALVSVPDKLELSSLKCIVHELTL